MTAGALSSTGAFSRRNVELNVAAASLRVTATASGENPFLARISFIFSAPATVSELTTIAS